MKFRAIAVIAFLLLHLSNVNGQNVDSLKEILSKTEGITRSSILYELGREYLLADENLAAVHAGLEGYRIAERFNDSLMIIKNGRIAASGLRLLGQIDSSITLFEKILPLSRKNENSPHHLFILNGLALAYTFTAEYDRALPLHFEYLEKKKYVHDISGEAKALNNIGLVYYKLRDYRKAQFFFQKTIALKRQIGDDCDLDIAYINLGLCHAYIGDFSNAKLNIRMGVETCGNNCSGYVVACADFAMGVVSFGLADYSSAERYCLKSYAQSTENNDQRFQFDNIDYLTQIYLLQNRISDASYYLSKAEVLINAGALYNLEMLKIYSRFFEMYNKVKNYRKASFYQQKYIQLKDSVYSDELTTNLMKVEADYVERENITKLKAQGQILLLKEEIIRRQKTLNVIICVLILFIVAFSILLWKNYQRKKRANVMLNENLSARTKELVLNRSASADQGVLNDHALSEIKAALSTINRLYALGLEDVSDPIGRQYIHKMNETSQHLRARLEIFLDVKKNFTV